MPPEALRTVENGAAADSRGNICDSQARSTGVYRAADRVSESAHTLARYHLHWHAHSLVRMRPKEACVYATSQMFALRRHVAAPRG